MLLKPAGRGLDIITDRGKQLTASIIKAAREGLRIHPLFKADGKLDGIRTLGLATSLKSDFLQKAAEYFAEDARD